MTKLINEEIFYDFSEALYNQLLEDDQRWGDTWEHLPIEGQIDRVMDRLEEYRSEEEFPLLKAIGNFYVCWVRNYLAKK